MIKLIFILAGENSDKANLYTCAFSVTLTNKVCVICLKRDILRSQFERLIVQYHRDALSFSLVVTPVTTHRGRWHYNGNVHDRERLHHEEKPKRK